MRDIFCRPPVKETYKAAKETYNRGVLPRIRKSKRQRQGGRGEGARLIVRTSDRASERMPLRSLNILYICIIMFVLYICSILFADIYIIVRVNLCVMCVYVSVCGLFARACRQGFDDEEIVPLN